MNYLFEKEFERQVSNLVQKDYLKALKISQKEFLVITNRLKSKLEGLALTKINTESGTLPFAIVINSPILPAELMMEKVEKDSKNGVTKLQPLASSNFMTISTLTIPKDYIYLLVDIDRGREFLNVRPEDALKKISEYDRSPLTINEGVALITHYPEFLIKNNCFSLLASRTGKDQRVPAIWINAKKQPNLGWCWDRNPHTWLGSASCKSRIGVGD